MSNYLIIPRQVFPKNSPKNQVSGFSPAAFLRSCLAVAILYLFLAGILFEGGLHDTAYAAEIPVDRTRLEGIQDNTPLARSGDKAGWDYLRGLLSRYTQKKVEQARPVKVSFMELDRQPIEYRGRLVQVEGKLLRCELIPFQEESTPFDTIKTLGDTATTDDTEISNNTAADEHSPEANQHRRGFYKSWVQLPDRLDIPVCILSLEVPENFPVDKDGLNEPVVATGFFYKRQLFLSSEGEEVTTPTIMARSFRWNPVVKGEDAKAKKSSAQVQAFWGAILTVLLLWMVCRFLAPRFFGRRPQRERIQFDFSGSSPGSDAPPFDGKIVIPGFADKSVDQADGKTKDNSDDSDDAGNSGFDNGTPSDEGPSGDDHPTPSPNSDQTQIVLPKLAPLWLLALLASAICLTSEQTLSAQTSSDGTQIDAGFTREQLLQMNEVDWETLGDERIPWEQQREPLLEMLDRLRRIVPYSFLRDNIAGTFSPINAQNDMRDRGLPIAGDLGQFRGKAFQLRGRMLDVEEIPLNPAERNLLGIPAVYRCRMLISGVGVADILTGFVPSAWLKEKPSADSTVYGVFVKRSPAQIAAQVDEPAEINTTDIVITDLHATRGLVPLLIAPRVEWFPAVPGPDAFLGSLGMDVGSFDLVPALSVKDLKRKQFDDLPPALQLLDRNEIIRRAFKFTEADRDPFYGLLQAVSNASPKTVQREAIKILEKTKQARSPVLPLFNDPAASRGQPVLLTGTAKRILPTLVEDKEVKKLYGIERYYQIYFFTPDSQHNPLVVCVTSLPEGLKTGSAPDYSERITVAAIPYKLWVYESSSQLKDENDNILGNQPAYAPLLIGQTPIWHPSNLRQRPGGVWWNDGIFGISFGIFLALFFVWIFLRRFRSNRTIEFKLGNDKR